MNAEAHYAGSREVVAETLQEHQACQQDMEVVMTPGLEQLLEEGLENLDRARVTEELRQRRQ